MLAGKRIFFLGSSVTYGSAAGGVSFVDMLAEKDGIIAVKEAVPGTTLVDNGERSYISRLKKHAEDTAPDTFVCQLSTNDATLGLPVGTIADTFDIESFDTSTVAGAIEYILTYVRKKWKCPVVFYTGTRYESENYAELVSLLLKIREKHNIRVIDMWNSDMNDIPKELYKRYMADGIHPTKEGYAQWWLPVFEKELNAIL